MCSSPSRLESLIPEILELIAFYAGTNLQGASSPDLLSLLCTSRNIYRLLACNSHLYGKIFTAKFDIAAVRRRLGDSWTAPDNLMDELRRRCMILRRVRKLEVENPVNVLINLWTMYVSPSCWSLLCLRHICQIPHAHRERWQERFAFVYEPSRTPIRGRRHVMEGPYGSSTPWFALVRRPSSGRPVPVDYMAFSHQG
jgi:hypothetical protein